MMKSTPPSNNVPLTPTTATFVDESQHRLPSCPPPPSVSQDEIDVVPPEHHDRQLQPMHRRPTRSSAVPYLPHLSSLPSLPLRREPSEQLLSNHANVVTPSGSLAGSPRRTSTQRKRSLFDEVQPGAETSFPSLSLGTPTNRSATNVITSSSLSRRSIVHIRPRPALVTSKLEEWSCCPPAVSSTPSISKPSASIASAMKHVSSSTTDMDHESSTTEGGSSDASQNMKRRRRTTLSDELNLRLSIDGGDCRRTFPRAA